LTGAFPEVWLFVLGGLFVLTTLVFPKGIVGLLRGLRLRRAPPPEEAPAGVEERA
jgi:urea transport system permease protein